MYEFVALSLKCRFCGDSLMDKTVLVDNEPSIKLNVKHGNQKGEINLSSIYGSYNYKCNIEIPKNEIVEFSCPHCNKIVNSDTECLTCGAGMVPFYLDMGGKVSICSRSGCKNHHVEFEDLSLALKKMYQEYGFRGRKFPADERKDPHKIIKFEKKKNESDEIIESGTFLQSYCPFCRKSLIENNMLKLKIINGEEGYLLLSPYLNSFTSKSTIFLPEDKTVSDVKCFHCDASLVETEKNCGSCGSPIAKINVSTSAKLIDFYMCTKKGCRWHGLSEEDLYSIKLEESDEW
ncbi:MAG: class I tRNA ligase family protein [Bacteroidales bacterium]|nr:class I tRNA ligase family protein [Bacteroidales bacterium]